MEDFNTQWGISGAFSLQLITDSLPVLVAYINQDLKYVFINQTYEKWFGVPRAAMMNHPLIEVLSPPIYQAVIPYIQAALAGEKAKYELRVPSRLGGYRYIEGTYTPDFAPDGTVRGVISHVLDVTEKKHFEEALKASQDKDQFLADAAQVLSSNLEISQIFASLGELVVPRLADWYGIELLNPDGELETVTASHIEPDKVKLALHMRSAYPSKKNAQGGPAAVVRTGKTEIVEWITDEHFEKLNLEPDYFEILKTLGFRSYIILPLRVRGKIIGVMNLVHAESGRRFTSGDVVFLEALAQRVGLAIENARLYDETKKQKDRLYELLMRAPVAISVRRGPDLVFELVNEPYKKLAGEERSMLGRTHLEVFPDTPKELLEVLRACAVEGRRYAEPESSLKIHWNNNGSSEKIFNLVYEPLLDDTGRPEGVISFAYEVTEQVLARRRVEETAEKFRLLTETIPHMVWTAEPNGRSDYFNERWYKYTGMRQGDTLHQSGPQFVHPEDLPGMNEAWERSIFSGEPLEYELRLKSAADGQYRWFIARALPMRDANGLIEKWFGTCTEIQGQKELEENLIKARTGAEKASLAKSNFLANMSHEIRTPMTAVLGFTEFLRDPELSEEDKVDCVSRIERSGRSLLRLIDDILDISKIEAGQLQLEQYAFSPAEIASEVVAMLKLQASHKKVALKIFIESDIPERIISDPTRVRQILVNLVGNAVKFTNEGQITVALRFTQVGKKNLLTFDVRDTGIGISPEDQPKLFSAFVQADDSITRKFGGSGLGLALSRRLAEKLGGTLELISSIPNYGSCFRAQIECGPLSGTTWLRRSPLPLEMEAPPTRGGFSRAEKPLKGLTILLTEDVPDNRALIRSYLELAGAKVDVAENGQQAIQKARQCSYDVILMDIQMPILDGIQATKRLRAEGYQAPILALTAHAMQEERELSLAAGCSDHLTKPIDRQDLLRQILKFANVRAGHSAFEISAENP